MTERPLALITGASGGIGLDLARCAAADGFDVALAGRRRDALEAAAGEISSRYRVGTSVLADDLLDVDAPTRLLAAVDRPIEVLVNNAGFGVIGQFAEMSEDDIDGMLRVNVAALTTLTRRVLPDMLARGHGGILNVASVAGFLSGPNFAVYYATKNYVLALSEALAEEAAAAGVAVTALCPGPVSTGFQDRAGFENSRMKDMTMMDAATCAATGWQGFRSGKRVVIPGTSNKLLAQAPRLLPRRLLTRMVGKVQEGV